MIVQDPRPRRGAIAAPGHDSDLDGSGIPHTLGDKTHPSIVGRVPSLPEVHAARLEYDSLRPRGHRGTYRPEHQRVLVHLTLLKPGSENGRVVRCPIPRKH